MKLLIFMMLMIGLSACIDFTTGELENNLDKVVDNKDKVEEDQQQEDDEDMSDNSNSGEDSTSDGSSGDNIVDDGTDDDDVVVTFEVLKNQILTPKNCLLCHSDWVNEEDLLDGVRVIPGDPAASKLFIFVKQGVMPPQPRPQLSVEEVELVERYIKQLKK